MIKGTMTTSPPAKETARKRPLADIENNSNGNNNINEALMSPSGVKATSTPRRIQNPYSAVKAEPKPVMNDKMVDEDVMVLSPPPPPARPISSDGSNKATETNDEEDCVMEWSNATNPLKDLPHGRPDCAVHSFANVANRIHYCSKCYCIPCDKPAKDCTQWDVHCQEVKHLTPDEEEDSDEDAENDVIDVEDINPGSRINPTVQKYYNQLQAQAAARLQEGGESDWQELEAARQGKYDHHYSNEFNHDYNNNGGKKERGRHPKDMRITEVMAQKLNAALQLSEGTITSAANSNADAGDPGFASRSEQRKKRFDRCKMQGDIPQLGLHKSFFVEGVRIGWPYPSILLPQRQMAIHLVKALKNSRHVVLESPTGTGKSAAILCAVLAWQRHHCKSVWGKTMGPDASKKVGPLAQLLGLEEAEDAQEKFPRIIYCSRTHSQVAQMVASLKKTPYRPRMTVLGSRERLCIHKNIRNKNPSDPNSSQDQSKTKSRANVNTACQLRVANTEKMRRALWKSYDYMYDDDKPPESMPGDGNGNGNASSQDDEDEDDPTGEREHSSEWILKSSTKKLTCPHYRNLTSARAAQMTRKSFLVNQDTIDCCKIGGEKTKLGVNDIEDLVSFGLNPYLEKSIVLYRRNGQSFGIDVGADCKIQTIHDDSPAKFNGQLQRGDKILAVNGRRVPNLNTLHKEMTKTSADMLDLKVLRSTSPSSTSASNLPGTGGSDQNNPTSKQVDVFLYRPLGQKGFGMTLEGEEGGTGCFVNKVKPGSAADSNGHVKEGDVIVSVNGEAVEHSSYKRIIEKIQATKTDPLKLSLRRRNSGEVIVDDNNESESDENGELEEVYSPHSVCPYYTSRALSKHAELLFAPYNYILDPGIRNALEINLDGAVVVLDEGHNVEGTLTESGSGKFGEIELSNLVTMLNHTATAAKSRQNLIEINGDEKDVSELAHELLLFVEKLVLQMRQAKEGFEESTGKLGAAQAIADYLKFHTPDNTEFEVSYSGPNGHGVNRKAVGCQPFFDKMKISALEVAKLFEYANAMQDHLKGDSRDKSKKGDEKGSNSSFDLLFGLLSKFNMATKTPEHFYISCVIQANGNLDHAAGEEAEDGRTRTRRFKKKPTNLPFIHPRSETNPTAALPVCNHQKCKQARAGTVLTPGHRGGVRHGQWCDGTAIPPWEAHLKIQLLFPGLLMKDLADKCRTVVLASGSISPLQSICAELDLQGAETSEPGRLQTKPPPLQANHVINLPKQLLACAVGTFPDGSPLTVNYNNYRHPEFFPRLGTAIASVIESIPSGGVLCFLPSYSLLNKCIKCWNPDSFGYSSYNTNDNSSPEIWDRFIRSKGKVIVEPTGSQEAFEAARDEYADTIRTDGSCILLAVFRGKMSEGISFNDDNARGVICVGIPFPNARDRSILAKKAYNDEQRKLKQRTDLLPGSDWYLQEAYRAVAQALGRCIRHEGDYGTVVLLDSRHCHDGSPGFVHKKLPKWMRNSVRTLSNGNRGFGHHPIVHGYRGLKREMEQFFAQAPGYTQSVLAKRKKEFDDALKRESAGAATKRKAPQQSVGYDGNSTIAKKVTQSPMPPSSTFPRAMKMENGVVDLCSDSEGQ